MKELMTEVVIHADTGVVWEILTDVEEYSGWNPFISRVAGKVKEDEDLEVLVKLEEGRQTFYPKVTKVDYLHEIRLKKGFQIPWIFTLEIVAELHFLSKDSCVLRQKCKASGVLTPIIWRKFAQPFKSGFEQMNQKLKKRAEAFAIKNRAINITRILGNGIAKVS